MEWSTLTAEQLSERLQDIGENDRWECKSAALLNDKTALKLELGKQVSAFANSGGGFIAIGFADGTFQPENCKQHEGRQLMADFLSTMVEQSVDNPLREFKIHRIPFEADTDQSVFVVEVGDSQAAPHQSRADLSYYYRIHGHSKRAPHFHIELLRSRVTKAVLEISEVGHELEPLHCDRGKAGCKVTIRTVVTNTSLQYASAWGLHAKLRREDRRWIRADSGLFFCDGLCARGAVVSLLPAEVSTVEFCVCCLVNTGGISKNQALAEPLSAFIAEIRAVSHNFLGTPHVIDWSRNSKVVELQRELASQARLLNVAGYGVP